MPKEVIKSRQNPTVKLVASLLSKKDREERGLYRFDGIKLCCEALTKGILPEYLLVSESRYEYIRQKIDEVIQKSSVRICDITVVSDDVFEKISEEKAPDGVITVVKTLDKLHKIVTINSKSEFLSFPEQCESVLVLEAIRDPGNLGTIIRTAASLGIDRLVLSFDCADIYNPKTIRGAMGSLFVQKIDILEKGQMPSYIRALTQKGRRVFAAALHRNALTLGELSIFESDCFVIGNEGHGLSQEVIEACSDSILIPMKENCESLNAAMAAGIFIWEMSRAKRA